MKQLLLFSAIALSCFACSSSNDASIELAEGGKSGSITRFAVHQNYMYVLNLNEVQTYDLTQKDHPVLVNRLSTDYGLETITIYDGSVFLGSTTALYILDISNPAAPVIQSKSDRLSQIGFSGCDPVVVKDNYAYSTIKIIANRCGTFSAESALVVYDISDKNNPLVVGQYTLNIPNGLGYKDNYLFICDEGSDQLLVFDISDPTSLIQTNYGLSITDPVDLIVDGQKMIVSAKTSFDVYDVTNVAQIKKIGQISK